MTCKGEIDAIDLRSRESPRIALGLQFDGSVDRNDYSICKVQRATTR